MAEADTYLVATTRWTDGLSRSISLFRSFIRSTLSPARPRALFLSFIFTVAKSRFSFHPHLFTFVAMIRSNSVTIGSLGIPYYRYFHFYSLPWWEREDLNTQKQYLDFRKELNHIFRDEESFLSSFRYPHYAVRFRARMKNYVTSFLLAIPVQQQRHTSHKSISHSNRWTWMAWIT